MALSNSILSSPGTSMRNIDRIFEDAQLKGILPLNSRKLKEFPKVACKYDLSDLIKADLSKNRLSELPEEICGCALLEELDCYNNVIRSVPDVIIKLQSLACLNLSRNQLTVIPVAVCHLPLQVLNLRNNRLVSIPEEISAMKSLRDLDVSCNEITIVPPQLGCVTSLQRLNLKRNLLLEIPVELCHLRLTLLDLSANRISVIPTQLRFMTSLHDLILDQNPMTFPPAVLCKRGRIHVFKFLEIQAIKEDKRGIVLETEFQKFRSPSILSDSRLTNGFTPSTCCRKSYTFDSGYSTSEGECRSQESQDLNGGFKKLSVESPRWETSGNLPIRNQNTNTLFNFIPSNGEEEVHDPITVQTFKEYKEALKKKREALNIYKKTEENGVELSPKLQVSKTKSVVASKQTLRRNEVPPVEEVPRGNGIPLVNTSVEITPKNTHIENDQMCFVEKVLKLEEIGSVPLSKDSNQGNFAWPKNSLSVVKPSKSSFTMRRELDKAREEQELISQLREILESRLKLKLPADLESALNDGVFLCHLANNIRANSVTCIHVPSPTVPKLTVAKCRRNADNFLEACRRLGVPNAELQYWAEAFLHSKENIQTKDISSPATQVIFSGFLLAIFAATALFLFWYPDLE